MADNLKNFQWTGIDIKGKRVQGVLQLVDAKDAAVELKKNGVELISIQAQSQLSMPNFKLFSRKKKIKAKDILLFTRFLSTMMTAGLPIVQALDIIAHDQGNPSMQALVMSIKNNVASGKTLAESFSQYPECFGDLYCNLIKSGEKSGTIDKVLKRIGNYLEKSENTKRKIIKAMIYPAAIITIAGIVSLVLLIFVVPQFQTMFSTFGAKLPFFTLVVVHVSEYVRSYWWVALIIVALSVWLVKQSMRKSSYIQDQLDKWLLRFYIIGPILQKGIIARYTRTLATTLEAGMPIVESMRSMSNIMGNRVYIKAIEQICNDVTSGRQLSASMNATKLFPNMVIQMIAVGEASGSLAEMLNKVADYYEDEVSSIVDNLSNLLEPIIMAVLGVIIGGFVVAMYLPIFRMGSIF
jgi:type IV pilus assembly protein PilC